MAETQSANEAILARLAALPSFNPASGDLFADFTLEPGDMIEVVGEDGNYQVPVYNLTLDWSGESKVHVEATGSEERPVTPLRKRDSYAAGKRAAEQEERLDGYYTEYINSKYDIGMVAGALGVVLDENGRPQYSGDRLVYDPNTTAEIFAKLLLTANEGALYAAIRDGAGKMLSYGGVSVAPGDVLIQAINNGVQGSSTVAINADKILLEGQTTLSDKVNVLGSMELSQGFLYVDGDIYATTPTGSSYHSVAGNLVVPVNCTLTLNGGVAGSNAVINNTKANNLVYSLTLTPPPSGSRDYTLAWDTIDGTHHSQTFNGAAAGWADAAAAVTWPQGSTNASFSVTVPDDAMGDTTSHTFTLSQSSSSNYVTCMDGSVTVARIQGPGRLTAGSGPSMSTGSTSGRTYLGAISYSNMYSQGYLFFSVYCDGRSRNCYITIN